MGLDFVINAINFLLSVLFYIIIAYIIISWLQLFGVRITRYNPVVRIIEDAAELMLRPIRQHLPVSAGGIDFSPMVAIIFLYLIQTILGRL